jgi:amino acid transporter
MSSSFPRAGGDYVYTSRLIHPALGFVASASAWIFWQMWYEGSFPISLLGESPGAGLGIYAWLYNNMGLLGVASAITSTTWTLIISALFIIIAGVIAMMNLRFYVKFQAILFAISTISLIVLLFALAQTTPQSFAANFNAMMNWYNGKNADWYSEVISSAAAGGYQAQPFDWGQTLAAVPVMMSALGYGFWSIYLAGEVKTAKVTRLASYAIYGSVLIMAVAFALMSTLLQNIGTPFYDAASYMFWTGGSMLGQMPFAPNFVALAMIATPNPIVVLVIEIGVFCNTVILMTMMYVVCSRVIFAQAMDWLFPQKLTQIGKRFVAPVYAILAFMIGSLIWLVVEVLYPTIGYELTGVVLGVLLAYMFAGVSAIIFPYKQKAAYESSPISKYKVGSVPLVSIMGVIALLFGFYLLYYYIAIPGLGLNLISAEVVVGVYAILFFWYYGMKWYRSRQGIDFNITFKEVPPE